MNMRRPALAALCTACVVATGISLSIGRTASGAASEEQSNRPLSSVPLVERYGQAALDAQTAFLHRMRGVEIRYGTNGAISWLKGRTGIVLPSGLAQFKVGQQSRELLDHIAPALLAAGTEELRVTAVANEAGKADQGERQSSPERAVNLVQYIRGREVQDSSVNIVLNRETNEITLVVANFLPDRSLPSEPKISAPQARAKVEAAMRDSGLDEKEKFTFQDYPASLAYAFEEVGDKGGVGGALVWVFEVIKQGRPAQANVNAITGEVVGLRSFITAFFPNRDSYTANATFLTPPNGMTFLFGEAGPPLPVSDPIPAALYSNAGVAFRTFDLVFGRNSWDGAGAKLNLVSHYGTDWGNGYYSPGGWLMFPDGEVGKKSAAEDFDAVTHEFTHGIVQNRLGLINANGPVDGAPAVNEGIADFGATVNDVRINGVATEATWQIGQMNPNNPLEAIRNLHVPASASFNARDWYPSRTQIPGFAHHNSTILGHAFYLLATGGQHNRAGLPGSEVPVIPVTGLGYENARNVFYYSMFTGILNSTSDFFSMRSATLAAALPAQQASVQQAWQAVGLGHNCTSAPQPPFPTAWPEYCKGRYDISWPTVPGTTRYHGQITQTNLGWAFAATVVDANVTSCHQDLPNAYWMMRVRACNGCGCSAWSHTEYMQYYNPCL
jgi:Zn-dependent metalloprotease